jgi:hypothetical protein
MKMEAVEAMIDATVARTGSQFWPSGLGVLAGTNTSAPGPLHDFADHVHLVGTHVGH